MMKRCFVFVLFLFFASHIYAEEAKILLHAVGTVYPQHKCILSSQVAGKVEKVHVDIGDTVKKGSALISLDPIFFELNVAAKEAACEAAKLDLQDSHLQLDRMKKLWEKPEGETPSIPQKRFDDAKTAYALAQVAVKQAEVGLIRAKRELDEATIKAPFDGVITKRFIDPGVTVGIGPQSQLLELQSSDCLYVEFPASQIELQRIQEGNSVFVEIDGGGSSLQKLDRIYPHVDIESRSVKCRSYLDKAFKVRPGSLVKVKVMDTTGAGGGG